MAPAHAESPMTWPWWRRAGTGALYGALGVVVVAATELVRGRIVNGQVLNRGYNTATSLDVFFLWAILVFPLTGALGGVLLPLYRFRHGGAVFGVMVPAVMLVLTVIIRVLTGHDLVPSGMPTWQLLAVTITLLAFTGAGAATLTSTVCEPGSEGRRSDPPVA